MPASDQPEHAGRECIGCHRWKPDEEFSFATQNRCRFCEQDRRRKRAGSALESHVSVMLAESRHRAKRKGVEFNLTKEDLLAMWAEQDGRCAISGMPLTHHRRGGEDRSLSNASLDRVNPRGQYSQENTHLVCAGVNLMRRHLELDEFLSWCRQVADHQARHWREQ